MQEIEKLIQLFSRLPSIGPRSARRIVLQCLKKRDTLLSPLAEGLIQARNAVKDCEVCGNMDTISPCNICIDTSRDETIVCVVEDIADLWALSRTGAFKGKFHILGGVLSPMDGVGPDDLNINGILQRVYAGGIAEIILATNLTVEGQSTAHYIAEKLHDMDVKITRLAHGVPVGGELEYLDDGTLSTAINSRLELD